ncbi:multidrug ABC transporter ATPase [Microbacterium sp. HM58-2]|nr:multidrug ABC transporter ATPase [Microbacterium sp. HM58-2]
MTASPDDRTEEAADAPIAPARKTPVTKAPTADRPAKRTPAKKVSSTTGAAKSPAARKAPSQAAAEKPAAKSPAAKPVAKSPAAKPAAKSPAAKPAAKRTPSKAAAEKAAATAETVAEPQSKADAAAAPKRTTTAARTAAARNSAARTAATKSTGRTTGARSSAAKTTAAKAAAEKSAAAKTQARTAAARSNSAKAAAAKAAATKAAAAKARAKAEKEEAVEAPASEEIFELVAPGALPDSAVAEEPSTAAADPAEDAPVPDAPVEDAPASDAPVEDVPEEAAVEAPSEHVDEAPSPETSAAEEAPIVLPTDAAATGEVVADVPAASAAEAIRVRGLVKSFGDNAAVNGIDLSVPAGSFYGIVGPNGAGKTTTLSIVAGLLRADAGSVVICGVDQRAKPLSAKRLMGVLPDRLRTFDRLTGRQLLFYYGLLRGLASDVIEKRVGDLARAFDLGDALSRVVSDYSAGMTKKIMLAGALIHSPRVLVLDEPFESVDPVSSAVILDILRAYVAHGGTVILSSHGMDLVERVCSRVAIIVGGEVLAEGTIDEVRAGQTLEARFVELAGSIGEVEGLEWLHTFSD